MEAYLLGSKGVFVGACRGGVGLRIFGTYGFSFDSEVDSVTWGIWIEATIVVNG